MTELQRLRKRVEELEQEVAFLKARPNQVFEYHYHQLPSPPQPYYVPCYPASPPYWTLPTVPVWTVGTITSVGSTSTLTIGPSN